MSLFPFTHCNYCKEPFTNFCDDWRTHLDRHIYGDPRDPDIFCLFCSNPYDSTTYRCHLKPCAQNYKDPNLIVCDDCNQPFINKFRYSRHYTRQHAPFCFSCGTCNKRFTSKSGLASHKALTNSCRPEDYIRPNLPGKCNVCLKHVANLKMHLVTTHSGKVMCDDCNVVFANSVTLAGHVGLHFSEKKRRFPCKVCGKRFSSEKVKSRHELLHSKPFICDVCGLSFTQTGSLKIHKLLHLPKDQRPFGCGYCGERFVTKWYKQQHEKKCDLKEIEY